MNEIEPKELRFKSGTNILNYIRQFSATEKVIFGLFAVMAFVTALIMVIKVNDNFSIEVPAVGGTLNEGVIGLPRSINPILAVTDIDRDLSTLVYSGLMKFSDGKMTTDLARSYKVSDDGLIYTFTLKPKITFQDGSALTTEDVAFTVKKIQDPTLKSPRRIDWANVTVKIISSSEIQFILKQPYSPFLTNTTIGIVPKHIWGDVSDEQFIFSQYNTSPIGSGIYKVTSVSHDNGGIPTKYTLESWRGYYGSKPFIPTIIFSFFSDESSALSALDQGNIDSLSSVSPEVAAKLVTDVAQSYKIISAPLPRVFGIFFNQNQSIVLADKVVRQALDMSIDRQTLINNVLKGYGVAIHGPVPFIASTSSPITAIKTTTSSSMVKLSQIESAQILLEKNSWQKGADGIYFKKNVKTGNTILAFDIFTADSPDFRQTAELVKSFWTKLGAKVSIKIYETNDLYQNIIRTRKYDALLFGEAIGKDRDLYAFWHSSQRNSPGLNIAMYANSKADKLLEEIRAASNEDIRATKYSQFDQIIRADIPAIFLYSPDFIYAVPKLVQNITLGSITTPSDRWNSVTKWYRQTEKVWKIFTK
ncbi:MAG: ABC transporter substrate-binding protein [Patescibacteria group bacterium]